MFKFIILFCYLILGSNYIYAQSNESLIERPELSIGYSNFLQDNSSCNTVNIGFGVSFRMEKESHFNGIFEVDCFGGKYKSKNLFGVNLLPGLRFKLNRHNSFIKFDLLTGLGGVSLKDSVNATNIMTMIRFGYGYKNITLELDISNYFSRELYIDRMLGISLRYSF